MKLYHGSINSNIVKLFPISNGNQNTKDRVVYLTESREYALFYIWDVVHNNRDKKWVTCFIKDGIVYYEEQFSNQLYKFYNGVKGYIYNVDIDSNFNKAKEPSVWFSLNEVEISGIEYISNVYLEIEKAEKNGLVKVFRYDDLSEEDRYKIDKKMSDYIILKHLLFEDNDDSKFMRENHINAWKMAESKFNL